MLRLVRVPCVRVAVGLRWTTAFALVLLARSAHAGGFEIPDNGSEALGRGGAFVAKASDGTAIYYNPAGLARQRGTHLLVDGNLYLHSFQFQRAGAYPDDPEDQQTPWGGEPYPLVKNTGGPLFRPFVALTTDFNYFDRLTVAAGLFSPPTITNRTFPLDTEQKPAPSRYDFVQARSSLLYPTLSAAFRVTRWLDLGVSGHLVLASFDETRVSYDDFGQEICKPNAQDDLELREDFRCDGRTTLTASGTGFAATAGAMIRPTPSLSFGLAFRTPTNIAASGTLTPTVLPAALPDGQDLKAGSATYALQLPWSVRAGGRYVVLDGDYELYDLELDVTYEKWGTAQALGPILTVPSLGTFRNIQSVLQHGYQDTFGVRGGGAYNIDTGEGIVSVRAGAYFDSAATSFANTRLDYDTLAKVAGTLGVGYKLGSFGLNASYAAVASIARLVGQGDGDIRPVNLRAGGRPEDSEGGPLPAVNEGSYKGFTHILSLGVSVSIDSLFGPPRKIHYGNSYEPNYVGDEEQVVEAPPPPPSREDGAEEKKPEPEEKKPEPEEKKPEPEKPAKPSPPPPPEEPEEPTPPPPPPEVKKPLPPAPPPPPPEKPATRRKEWWEEPQ